MAIHLPKRCLCQFGFVQDIPRPVAPVPAEGIDKWFVGNIVSSTRVIRDHALEVLFFL